MPPPLHLITRAPPCAPLHPLAPPRAPLTFPPHSVQIDYDPEYGALVLPVPVAGWRQGCMAPSAVSYDPLANSHDQAACTFAPFGCMDSTAANFAPNATRPGYECITYAPAATLACLVPFAFNYDSAAAAHIGTPAGCTLPLLGCMDSNASNYRADTTISASSPAEGACVPNIRGCSAPGATNYDSLSTVDDGSCHMMVPLPPPPPPSPPSPCAPPEPPSPPPAPPSPPSQPPSLPPRLQTHLRRPLLQTLRWLAPLRWTPPPQTLPLQGMPPPWRRPRSSLLRPGGR